MITEHVGLYVIAGTVGFLIIMVLVILFGILFDFKHHIDFIVRSRFAHYFFPCFIICLLLLLFVVCFCRVVFVFFAHIHPTNAFVR